MKSAGTVAVIAPGLTDITERFLPFHRTDASELKFAPFM
jgi:hypothetical protein